MIHATDAALFAGAYASAVAMPGPGVAALIGRVLADGTDGVWKYLAGFVVGDLIWLGLACASVAAATVAFSPFLKIIRFCGAAYLLFTAFKIFTSNDAFSGPRNEQVALSAGGRAGNDFGTSLALALGNPKVIVFFIALLPTVVNLRRLTLDDTLLLGMLIAAILPLVLSGYVLLAARSRSVFTQSRRSMDALRFGTALVLGLAAVAIMLK